MVATVGKLSSSSGASTYFEADDYYIGGEISPSEWQGQAAAQLGLSGDVDRDTFKTLLDGQVNGEQLGTKTEDGVKHAVGTDITLSAPKSLSAVALVAGDKRLIDAHQKASRTAMAVVEKQFATTRIREDGSIKRELTGNLAIASFTHFQSRENEPQLHTHNVILNMTQSADGQWRSLEARAFYQFQKDIGALYRQELALLVRELGYEVKISKDSMFEIVGVPQATMDALSTRTAQIDERLAERGTSRAEASALEKQIAALDTRKPKLAIERDMLIHNWRATADAAGFGEDMRKALVKAAIAKSAHSEHKVSLLDGRAEQAQRAVAFAAEKLGERQSVFAEAILRKEAGQFAMGKIGQSDIDKAIKAAAKDGQLFAQEYLDKRGAGFAGFTTRTNIENEKTILRLEANGRGQAAPLANRVQAAKAVLMAERQFVAEDLHWTADQRSATIALLTSSNRIVGVQGYAGTAKTTTVLATYAAEARKQGFTITALAPTASAANVLGHALNLRSDTIARHLLAPERGGTKSIWVVDEASMVSSADMARLLTAASKAEARIVLAGDVKQLGAVGAGAALKQLFDAGMETANLAEIVRQSNSLTKEAVEASIAGDARRAFIALDRGGGRIVEMVDGDKRLGAIAADYARLSLEERKRTLVIEPSRAGRDALNEEIRQKLKASGGLRGEAIHMQALESKGLTRAEAKDVRSYAIGDVIKFSKDFSDKGVVRGEALAIRGIDPDKNIITLERNAGDQLEWRPRQWGAAKSEVFTPKEIELQAGDRIAFTRNDRHLSRTNGAGAEVISVDANQRQALIKLDSGKQQALSMDKPSDQHIRHNYAQTAYAAQGKTAERVLINANSRSTNLVDQKLLYVGISRAKVEAVVYTDDRQKLTQAMAERAGEKQTALGAEAFIGPSSQKGAQLG
jgi:conjugative relaxase-like TrwC/TraI family protein